MIPRRGRARRWRGLCLCRLARLAFAFVLRVIALEARSLQPSGESRMHPSCLCCGIRGRLLSGQAIALPPDFSLPASLHHRRLASGHVFDAMIVRIEILDKWKQQSFDLRQRGWKPTDHLGDFLRTGSAGFLFGHNSAPLRKSTLAAVCYSAASRDAFSAASSSASSLSLLAMIRRARTAASSVTSSKGFIARRSVSPSIIS